MAGKTACHAVTEDLPGTEPGHATIDGATTNTELTARWRSSASTHDPRSSLSAPARSTIPRGSGPTSTSTRGPRSGGSRCPSRCRTSKSTTTGRPFWSADSQKRLEAILGNDWGVTPSRPTRRRPRTDRRARPRCASSVALISCRPARVSSRTGRVARRSPSERSRSRRPRRSERTTCVRPG